jgi:multidrug resistance protein, MATE family
MGRICIFLVAFLLQFDIINGLLTNHGIVTKHKPSLSVLKVALSTPSADSTSQANEDSPALLLPRGDDLDRLIFKLSVPAVLNLAILPLVGAVDTFWVGRMGNALCLAGQGAANQIFNSAFWICSFLPNIVTPLVAKAAGSRDDEVVKTRVNEAFFIASIMGVLGAFLLGSMPQKALNLVLGPSSGAWEYATPYLSIRALTFLPAIMISSAFAVFRGTMDVVTPLKIALFSNALNVLVDPLLIFNANMGVAGAACATCLAELSSFLLYTRAMVKRNLVDLKNFKMPDMRSLKPLLVGGVGVQMRAIAMNVAFLAVTRTTQALDTDGTAAAAHAITIQLWQLGGIVLLALSTVASILVPREMATYKNTGEYEDIVTLRRSQAIANRMFMWGLIMGIVLGGIQLLCLPLLQVFSPLPNVQEAARLPSIVGACLQIINGAVFIGEGIQQGNQCFGSLAATTAVAASAMLTWLRFYGNSLTGVWTSFAIFNFIRLAGVMHHHFIAGPLAPRYTKHNV